MTAVSCDDEDTSQNDNRYLASEAFEFRLEKSTQVLFALSGINGEVEITGVADSDSVIITGERRVRSDSQADADQSLENLEVIVTDSDSQLTVRTEQPQHPDGRDYEVHYTVVLPHGLSVIASNVNGTVDVQSTDEDPDARWAVTTQIVNGNLSFEDIHGPVNGSVVNGRIDCSTRFSNPDTCALTTVNGLIDLYVPHDVSAEFSARVVNGTITLIGLTLQNAMITDTAVTGTLGAGDGAIMLHTTNGSIRAMGN